MKNTYPALQKQIPKIISKHVYGNLYKVNLQLLSDLQFLTKMVVESARLGNLHIVELATKKFGDVNGIPGGVSIIAILEESHIALHTWPESEYATLDIYSCGHESNPEAAFRYIVSKLNPKKQRVWHADRGNK
jgi:S-adenosylmethionine decarboxylase